MLRQPTRTAPARRSAATAPASRCAGGCAAWMREPASVVTPATSKRFLTANGTPARGAALPPGATMPATRAASALAASRTARLQQLSTRSRRLAEDTQGLFAIGEAELSDAEPGGLSEEDRGEPGGRHLPHLDRDRRAVPGHADHRGMPVADRPEAVVRPRGRLAREARTGRDQIAVQLEAAHQRAVHRQPDGQGALHLPPSASERP